MSTAVGTLEARKTGRSIWPVTFVAILVMLSVAVIAVSIGRDQARTNTPTVGMAANVNTPSELAGIDATFVGGTAANTPSELTGGIAGGFAGSTSANTPTELSGGIRHKFASPLGNNTPTELSGGIVGGLPPEVYDRHQRG